MLFLLAFTSLLFLSFSLPAQARSAFSPHDLFDEIDLPPLQLQAQIPSFDFDLSPALPPAASTFSDRPDLPDDCTSFFQSEDGSQCTSPMVATDIIFEDCGQPFTVCRCGDANMTLDSVADRLGRVPVGFRRYVGTVMVFTRDDTQAYTNLDSGDIHVFGDFRETNTWVHEAAHAFDYAAGGSEAPSSSEAWAQAIVRDNCVSDSYSLRNRVEDFAQMSVVKIYMLLHDGNLPPGLRADCMSNQLDFMATLPVFNTTSLFGNTCNIPDGAQGIHHGAPPAFLNPDRAFKTFPLDSPPAQTSGPKVTSPASRPTPTLFRFWGVVVVVGSLMSSLLIPI